MTNTNSNTAKALQYLSGVCDGAIRKDGAGFNRYDAPSGLALANISMLRELSVGEEQTALRMLQKYRKQLESVGIEIPVVSTENQRLKDQIVIKDTLAFVYFLTGIPSQVLRAELKKIAGWHWNPDLEDKPWSFPANALDKLSKLIPDAIITDKTDHNAPKTTQVAQPQAQHKAQKLVTVKLNDDQIFVYFSREGWQKYGLQIKALPERKWNPDLENKPWIIPNRFASELCDILKDENIDPEVAKIAKNHQELSDMSRKSASDFQVPGMKLPLLPYQNAGVEFLEKANGRAILGDEMGLGKTPEALAYLQLHPEMRPAIIVVPSSLKINWNREIQKFMTTSDRVCILSGTKAHDLDLLNGTIFIINYDILASWLSKLIASKPEIVIFDEAHFMKNSRPKSAKSTNVTARKGSQRGNAGVDLAGASKHVLCLTGTAIVNRPIELFPLLNMVDPKAWGNRWRFIQTYCNPVLNGGHWDYTGASNLDNLHQIIKPWFVRREKSEVLKELPEKRRSTVVVEFDKNLGSDYKSVMDGMLQVIKNSEAEHNPTNVLAQIERAKQATAIGKLPAVIDWIKNFLDTNGKLVVFATHQFTVDKLMEAFGDRAVKVTGEITGEKRMQAVDNFQNNSKIRLFVGNIKAAGVGLTLTAASDVAFLEYPWTPGDLEQAADRVHRIGQKNAVNVYYLVGEETIEEDIVELLQSKAEVLGQVLDGKPADLEINIYSELVARIKAELKG